jgi:hypothetical protein
MLRPYFNLIEDEAKAILKNRRQRNEQNWKVRKDRGKNKGSTNLKSFWYL